MHFKYSNRMDQTETDHVTHHPQQTQTMYVSMFMYLGHSVSCQVHKEEYILLTKARWHLVHLNNVLKWKAEYFKINYKDDIITLQTAV